MVGTLHRIAKQIHILNMLSDDSRAKVSICCQIISYRSNAIISVTGRMLDHGHFNAVQMNVCGQSEDFPSVATTKNEKKKKKEWKFGSGQPENSERCEPGGLIKDSTPHRCWTDVLCWEWWQRSSEMKHKPKGSIQAQCESSADTHTHTRTRLSSLPERKCSVHKYLEFANWKNLGSFGLGAFFKHSVPIDVCFFLELSAALFISARWNGLRLSYTHRVGQFWLFYRSFCLAIKAHDPTPSHRTLACNAPRPCSQAVCRERSRPLWNGVHVCSKSYLCVGALAVHTVHTHTHTHLTAAEERCRPAVRLRREWFWKGNNVKQCEMTSDGVDQDVLVCTLESHFIASSQPELTHTKPYRMRLVAGSIPDAITHQKCNIA